MLGQNNNSIWSKKMIIMIFFKLLMDLIINMGASLIIDIIKRWIP